MKTFKLLLLLALVFVAGAAVGVVGTRSLVRRQVQLAIARPERVQLLVERRLTRQLLLDDSQQAKLHAILNDAHGQLDVLRSQYTPQMVAILRQANQQINAILTPEQEKRFEEIKQRNHPLWRALQPGRAQGQ